MAVGRRAIAWGLVVVGIALGPGAARPPPVSDLLGPLDLSGYPPTTKAPQFSGRTPDGQKVSLSGLRGRVILLSFWATWCPPCRQEMPLFEQLHRDFGKEGLTVLGVNVREDVSAIRSYARELDLTFPLVLDPTGAIGALYGVIGLPSTFLIARDGRAVARAVGPRDWGNAQARQLFHALLAEPREP
ncbi:MAG: peroxiredoxin family protein [Anaerolineae bacterium]